MELFWYCLIQLRYTSIFAQHANLHKKSFFQDIIFGKICIIQCFFVWLYHNIILLIRGEFNKFPDFFVPAFKTVVDSWTFSMLLLYMLWDDYDFRFKWTATAAIGIHPGSHTWWISKMQSGREDTLEERYAIKFCFKLGKNATETYGVLFDHLVWFEYQFLSGIRDSRKAGSLWGGNERYGRSKEVNRPELISQKVRVMVTMLKVLGSSGRDS